MEIFNFFSTHWAMISSLIALAVGVILLFFSSRFVRRNDCTEHRAALDKEQEAHRAALDKEQTTLKKQQDDDAAARASLAQTLGGMPTAKDMHNLQISIEKLTGRLDTMQQEIKGQRDVLNIVKEHTDRVERFLYGPK